MVHDMKKSRMNWKVERCGKTDKERVQILLESSMYNEEPLATTYDDKSKEELNGDLRALDILSEGHSFAAVTPEGRVVGIAVNKTCPYNIGDVEPVQSIVELTNSVEAEMKMECEGLLDIFMLAVDPEFRQQGMAKALVAATLEHAKASGFRGVKVTATSLYTSKVAESLGFKVFYSLAYKDYKDKNGKVVFNPPAPHTHMNILLREFVE